MTTPTTENKTHPNDLVLCADKKLRPRWASRGELSWRYFDDEWGRGPCTESGYFEAFCLVVFQLGLTWHAVLSKRAPLRAAFSEFRVGPVAGYGEDDVKRLLDNPAIFRNRRKIEAAITNAKALMALEEPLKGILKRHATAIVLDPTLPVPTSTPESVELARELKRLGFTHIGPVAAFSLMQATGAVNVRQQYDLNQ